MRIIGSTLITTSGKVTINTPDRLHPDVTLTVERSGNGVATLSLTATQAESLALTLKLAARDLRALESR